MSAERELELSMWGGREWLAGGWSGAIYALDADLVVKVGRIEPAEARIQIALAKEGWALPVFDYVAQTEVPDAVRQEVCLVHGRRMADRPERLQKPCSCQTPLDLLLMPRATPLTAAEAAAPSVIAFMDALDREVRRRFGQAWDAIPENVARYEGRLIGLDFGYYPSLWRQSWTG